MKLRNRFLLIGIGILTFCVVTPILILYARGYKFDYSSKRLLKTGSLVIKTEPAKAAVVLNGKPVSKSETPATLRFLLPGDYDVTVKKDGYQAWTKRLTIKSQLVTWANQDRETVTLFYDSPKEAFSDNADYATGSRPENNVLFIKQGQLYSISPDQSNPTEVAKFSDLAPFNPTVSLAPDNIYQLVKNRGNLKLTADQLNQLGRIESNGGYTALTLSGNLYFQPNGGSLAQVAAGVDAFTLSGNELWYLQKGSLIRLNLKLNISETIKPSVPQSSDSRIIRTSNYVFLIIDRSLYSINGEVAKIYDGVDYAEWDGAAQKLVFGNGNEVSIYDPLKLSTDLILRSSSTIEDPIVNDRTGYLFFYNENKIKAIELDGRDHRNIYTIASAPHVRFLVNDAGTNLLTYTDSQIRIYEIR